ncbi:MAG: 4'-phosphopantetheinyl transferase superfamily protein [Pseudomonadota bacterium]
MLNTKQYYVERAAIHAESFDHQGGPVFYASLPCSTDRFKEHRTDGSEDRRRLIFLLWEHLMAMENPIWKRFYASHETAFPPHIVHGPLGRPHLLLGGYRDRGPAISFSEGGGYVWAALCCDESDIGIDAAGTDEFQKNYPFHRVFNDRELHHILSLVDGDLGSASALLWSIKEAVVKAIGCAFHLVDPLQISVHSLTSEGGFGYTFPVRLSRKALMRFPIGTGPIWVRSFPLAKMWISIAILNWQTGRMKRDGKSIHDKRS